MLRNLRLLLPVCVKNLFTMQFVLARPLGRGNRLQPSDWNDGLSSIPQAHVTMSSAGLPRPSATALRLPRHYVTRNDRAS
jgi:hypothetical protein